MTLGTYGALRAKNVNYSQAGTNNEYGQKYFLRDAVGQGKKRAGGVLDRKIFWEQTFASFLESNFALEFAEPGGIWRIRQITAEICRICQI
jgi:hypothetical protein